MYIFNAFLLLITGLGTIGSPSNILLPLCFALALGVQALAMERLRGRKRWIFIGVLAAMLLLLELGMHALALNGSYAVLILIIMMAYTMALFLGALLGVLLGRLLIRLEWRKEQ